MNEFTKPKIVAAWMMMADGCDESTWLDYMGNLVMDIRSETWSMAVLCRSIYRGVTYEHPKRIAKARMLCRWIC